MPRGALVRGEAECNYIVQLRDREYCCIRLIMESDGSRICITPQGEPIIVSENEIDDSPRGLPRPRGEESSPLSSRVIDIPGIHDPSSQVGLEQRNKRARRPLGKNVRIPSRTYTGHEVKMIRAFQYLNDALSRLGLSGDPAVHASATDYLRRAFHEMAQKGRRGVSRDEDLRLLVAYVISKTLEIIERPISYSAVFRALDLDPALYMRAASRFHWVFGDTLAKRVKENEFVNKLRDELKASGVDCASNIGRVWGFIHTIVSNLKIPQAAAEDSLTLLTNILKVGGKSLCGRKADALAAAAIYLTISLLYGGMGMSQKQIANTLAKTTADRSSSSSEAGMRKQLKYILNDIAIVVEH